MNKTWLVIYFWAIGWYYFLKSQFFKLVPRIVIVKDADSLTNMTLQYYLGYSQTGYYIVKIITDKSTHHVPYYGPLNQISNITIKREIVKRQNVILFNEDRVVDLDLNVLDDYYVQSKYESTVSEACRLLGHSCTRVKIIDSGLVDYEEHDATQLNLSDLYLL